MKVGLAVVGLLALAVLLLIPVRAGATANVPVASALAPTNLEPLAPTNVEAGGDATLSGVLRDAVTAEPLAGQNLTFALNTTFGWLSLGVGRTDSDGVAAVSYHPVGSGIFLIRVSFLGDALYAPSNGTISLTVASAPTGPSPVLPVDRIILLVILGVVGGVWATYGFVAREVLGIRRDAPMKEKTDRRGRSTAEVKTAMATEHPEEQSPMRVSRRANATGRAVPWLTALALVLGAVALGVAGLSALAPKAATYTPTTVSFQLAIVPDLQGGGWDAFVPDTLVVHQGDTVRITIINADEMAHGFQLDAFGVNERIEPGFMNMTTGEITPTVTTISFVASQSGSFIFRCNVPCGDGHEYMTGTLQVLGT